MLELWKLNPKRSWASRLASLRRNLLRLLLPLCLATLATVLWHQCHKRGWHVPSHAEAMLATGILVLAAIFAIAAALILDRIWERTRAISRYILTRNKRAFMEIRDEKMPIAMHLVLAASGLWVLVLLAAAEYPSSASGALVVFSSWFSMLLYFVVITDLQDPTTSVWFSSRIQPDWIEQDVDAYFNLDGEDGKDHFKLDGEDGKDHRD